MRRLLVTFAFTLAVVFPAAQSAPAAEARILLPLGRTAYQTDERIEISVLRTATPDLGASDLKFKLTGDDGSAAAFSFAVPGVTVKGKDARATEHFYVNGSLLRPGHYRVEVSVNGADANAEFDVFSHVRKSSFKLIGWGNTAEGPQQEAMGEDSVGFNLLMAKGWGDHSIRGGVDWMQCCTQGGAHQMDMRQECDWSDPYVIRGGTARLSRAAFYHRLNPNAVGLHCYDEPGLSWCKDPETGQMVPHLMPAQLRAFRSAFGHDLIRYSKVNPDNGDDFAQWVQYGNWKLAFMDATWKLARFATEYVRPDYLTVTQSQYGWNAYADGYSFMVARSLPVISGHGGYDDFGPEYFNPSFFLEMARARELAKPNWYLPCWYSSTPANRFRMEQYLSFMLNLQGLATPPDIRVQTPSTAKAAEGVVESNKLLARLGTIFTTMPVTRPQVAVLYSMSQNLYAQSRDMTDNYAGGQQRDSLVYVYLAGKLLHVPFQTVVDEDVVDGTLAANHKAVVLSSIQYLDPKVVTALESFAFSGGLVLLTGDCAVQVKGATRLAAKAQHFDEENLKKLRDAKDWSAAAKIATLPNLIKSAEPLAKEIEAELKKVGVGPAYQCDNIGIAASRQAHGDIEYLFAVNACSDDNPVRWNGIKPTVATIALPADGRRVYDAVMGGEAAQFQKKGDLLSATLRFGPGQMRVFARTASPIGGVQALRPTVFRDYTVASAPLRVDIGAVLVDDKARVLSGSAPLHVRVIDPLGATRYELYRATAQGTFKESLQLGANDPSGEWKVVIKELLSNKEDAVSFSYSPAGQCGALAGAAYRAISFPRDRQSIYRFFRVHKDIAIVPGGGEYNAAAAQRLTDILRPWDVRCRIVSAAEARKPRVISAEEAQTWCGLSPGRASAGGENNPVVVGFALREPAILLGTPEDNPLIAFLLKEKFLPYVPKADEFPGRGRGLMAWQRDGVGYEQESITLIAHDADGMAEAVGSLYEVLAGLDPVTQWKPASGNSVAAASKAHTVFPAAQVKWETALPDRAAAMRVLAGKRVAVLSQDGTLAVLDAAGNATWQTTIAGNETWAFDASADGQTIAVGTALKLFVLDGAGKKVAEQSFTDRPVAQGLTCVAVSRDGSRVAVACADGGLAMLGRDGKSMWSLPGMAQADIRKWEDAVKEWEAGAERRAAELKEWQEDVKRYEGALKEWEAVKNNKAPKPKKPDRPQQPGRPPAPRPDACNALAFCPDGKALLVLGSKSQLLDAADGRTIAPLSGFNERPSAVAWGADLLLTDGKDRVAKLSAADGKLTGQIAMPGIAFEKKRLPNNVAAAVPFGDGVMVGTEGDWTVRKLKAVEGKLEDQTVWAGKADRRIVKKLAVSDGLAAVAYWGGTVRVLDGAGLVKCQNVFQQDVAELVWLEGKLLVGLADGRIVAIEPKP